MREPLVIRGQWGLGDNIYARPFIRAAAQVYVLYLETPWPELYEDMPVRFLRAERRLRTQMYNVQRQGADIWSHAPKGTREVRLGYGHPELSRGSIIQTIERQSPVKLGQGLVMDLPPSCLTQSSPDVSSSGRPLAFVRPVTSRREWRNDARNPESAYISEAAGWLMDTHCVVLVGDLRDPSEEWLVGSAPPHHINLTQGQLTVTQMLSLFSQSDIVVGGVGWIVPAALATGVRTLVLLGGMGGHNSPDKVTDPRLSSPRLGFIHPKRFCQCSVMAHRCDKRIFRLQEKFRAFVSRTDCLTNLARAA